MESIYTEKYTQWKISIFLLLLTLAPFIFLHKEIFFSLINWWWTTSKYAHSLIIFPAIIYLVFEQRAEIKKQIIKPDYLALLPLSLAVILLSLFDNIDVQIITETLFVLIIPLTLWAIMGRQILSIIVIPLTLLITVAPIWELFAPLLTDLTAHVAHFSLNILGVPVFKDEMYLTIPEGVFLIAEGCGGFRYFISGLSLGLIFAHLNYNTFRQQSLIILIAIILSIVTNWVRVMIVIWAGHVTDMQHPYVTAHVNLGWYVFAIAFFLYFFICSRFFSTAQIPKKVNPTESQKMTSSPHRTKIIGSLILFTLLAPNFVIDKLSTKISTPLPTYQFIQVDGWEKPKLNSSDWSPLFNGANQYQIASYTKDTSTIDIFYALYQDQSQGNELINFQNSITNKNWMDFKPKNASLSIGNNTEQAVKKIRAHTQYGERTIWTWYIISDVQTADRRLAKLLELKKVISSNKLSIVIAVSTVDSEATTNNKALVESLLAKVYPDIMNHFSSQIAK